jgi:hypothetical protein
MRILAKENLTMRRREAANAGAKIATHNSRFGYRLLPSKILEGKACVFENPAKQALGQITGVERNHQERPCGMLENLVRSSLPSLAIALPNQETN